MSSFDDPGALADEAFRAPRPLLVGLDVDGVLAPLVDHAADAALLDGMSDAMSEVAALESVQVAVLSGRSLDGLAQFGFHHDLHVIGSHGMETRDRPLDPLDDAETERLAALEALAEAATRAAGEGSWVEHKPASVVVHVRRADPERGRRALEHLAEQARGVEGATAKPGSNVLELFARSADKGTALVALGAELRAATILFAGDDVTDEDAFARLGPDDIAIKVGDADTIAPRRLRDPAAVLAFLRALAALDR